MEGVGGSGRGSCGDGERPGDGDFGVEGVPIMLANSQPDMPSLIFPKGGTRFGGENEVIGIRAVRIVGELKPRSHLEHRSFARSNALIINHHQGGEAGFGVGHPKGDGAPFGIRVVAHLDIGWNPKSSRSIPAPSPNSATGRAAIGSPATSRRKSKGGRGQPCGEDKVVGACGHATGPEERGKLKLFSRGEIMGFHAGNESTREGHFSPLEL